MARSLFRYINKCPDDFVFKNLKPRQTRVPEGTSQHYLEFGAYSVVHMKSVNSEVVKFYKDGQLQKARELLEELLNDQMYKLGEMNPATLSTTHNLATIYFKLSNLERSKSLFERSYSGRRDILGARHRDTLLSLIKLSDVFIALNDVPAAISHLRLSVHLRRPAKPSPQLCVVAQYNTSLQDACADKIESITSDDENLDDIQSEDPIDDDTGSDNHSSNSTLDELGQLQECEYEPSELLPALTNLAALCARVGRLEEAKDVYADIIAIHRNYLRPGKLIIDNSSTSSTVNTDVTVLQPMSLLADTLVRLKQVEKADAAYCELIDMKTEVYGNAHVETATSKYALARLRQSCKRYGDAATLFLEVFNSRRGKGDGLVDPFTDTPANPEILAPLLNLGLCLYHSGQLDETIRYLQHYLTLTPTATPSSSAGASTEPLDADRTLTASALPGKPTNTADLESSKTRVQVLTTLGASLFRTKQYAAASLVLTECLANQRHLIPTQAREIFPPSLTPGLPDPETLSTMHTLGVIKAELAKTDAERDEAQALLTECWAARSHVLSLSPLHSQAGDRQSLLAAVATLNALANVLKQRKLYAAAEPYFVTLCDLRRALHGAQHADTMNACAGLVYVLLAQRKDEQAEKLLEELLAYRALELDDDHPLTADTLIDLAMVCYRQGQLDSAEPLLKEGLGIRQRSLGPSHRLTLMAQRSLANLCYSRGAFDRALLLYDSLLSVQRSSRDITGHYSDTDTNSEILSYLLCVSSLHYHLQQYPQAETVYTEVLQMQFKLLPPESAEILLTKSNLANVYFRVGKYEQSRVLLEECLSNRRETLGLDHHDCLAFANNLAGVCMSLRLDKRAEELYRDTLERRRRVLGLGDDHPDTLLTMNNLGSLLCNMKQYSEAESLLSECLQRRTSLLGADHEHVSLTAAALNTVRTHTAPKPVPLLTPVLEESETTAPQSVDLEDLRTQTPATPIFRSPEKIGMGLADRIALLDPTKLRFGPPPPSLHFKAQHTYGGHDAVNHCVISPTSSRCDSGDPRYESYLRMRLMRVPDGAIRQKMARDGTFTQAEIDTFFAVTATNPNPNPGPNPVTTDVASSYPPTSNTSCISRFQSDPRFALVIKLRSMKVPEVALLQKMKMDTEHRFTTEEIEEFLAESQGMM